MPRPSLKDVRTEELLDAFMRSVARFGIEGSTLERISEEAGVGRPLLRHYLGNREEMVALLLDHVFEKFSVLIDGLITALPDTARVPALVDILFDDHSHEFENAAVFQALVASADRYPGISEKLMGFVTEFETAIENEIAREHPAADQKLCQMAAAGVTAIYFNHDATLPLQPPADWRDRQKMAALALLASIN